MVIEIQWTTKYKDMDVVCNKTSPKELSCEFRKRQGDTVLPAKIELAWGADGRPEITKMEGNPDVIKEGMEFVKDKITVELK